MRLNSAREDTESEAVSRQRTLNSALGNLRGGPKWLVWSAARPERPPGTLNRSPTESSSSVASITETSSNTPMHHPHPLSTSTSPQLPNAASEFPHASPAPCALPSPAPSENHAQAVEVSDSSTSTSRNGMEKELVTYGPTGQTRTTNTDNFQASRFMEGVRQAVGTSPWPLAQPRQPEIAQVDGVREDPIPFPPCSENIGQQQVHNEPRVPVPPLAAFNQQQGQLGSLLPLQASNYHAQSRYASSGSLTTSVQQLHTVPSPLQLPSSGPQPLDPFSQAYCQPILTHFLALARDRKWQFNVTETPRINLLQRALAADDREYLMIHQIYCLHTQLEQDQLTTSTHLVLRQVLGDNTNLSCMVRDFFATFPVTVQQLAEQHPREHSHQQAVFRRFAERSSFFETQKMLCVTRRVPVSFGELVHNLGIFSPVLQDTIFLLIMRLLYPELQPGSRTDPRWEGQALALLNQNRREFTPRFLEELHSGRAYPAKEEWDRWSIQTSNFAVQLAQSRLPQQQMSVPQQLARPPGPGSPTHPSTPTVTVLSHHPHVATPAVTAPVVPGPSVAAMPRHGAQPRRGRPPSRTNSLPHPPPSRPPPSHLLPSHPLPSRFPPPTVSAARSPYHRLVPPIGTRLDIQREPNPSRFALHQANLRSPLLRPQSASVVLYQHVTGFAKPPTRPTEAGQGVVTWTFSVSDEEMSHFPKDIPSKVPGKPPSRIVDEHSKLWRLRCVKWLSEEPPNDHDWATADTSWMPYTYFTFNGTNLHMRRKVHWGKDLPIDLTSLIKQGDNVLEISVLDEKYLQYRVAIEVVSFQKHEDIKQFCLTQNRVSDLRVTEDIRRRLCNSDGGDDEIAIVQSQLTMNLLDPISRSGICATPVRSTACLHYDCFDLETYLQSRTRKGNVSVADVWRCPICKADARPQFLIFDAFLDNVRQDLEERGLAHTSAIIVDKHGVWEPKPETPQRAAQEPPGGANVGERQRSIASTTSATAGADTVSMTTPEVEVIDLT
ncbi:uncharacterized protein EI97DRAFT_432692 [Westerdykella ornata]|uniref:SP-RING-type domain-containing protein n=1 Tax=Westerdykella ornata TaxID=318751 RepID=A0A6A6JLE4_WESOR|nr:uncharacterized protein EI97DRAFT_432692 [Westerdykella ornata]KAF2277074.1 hypothetical protein EI97DRAFT_432692 [Westerdykella ornata]